MSQRERSNSDMSSRGPGIQPWNSIHMQSRSHNILLERIRARRAKRKTFQLSKLPGYIFGVIQNVCPEMGTILIGMRDGMVSLGYICILLVLILYIYAVAGCVFFQKNDMWHFRSIEIAFVSLFLDTSSIPKLFHLKRRRRV